MTLCGKSGGARRATDDTVIRRTRFACCRTTASRHTFRLCNTYDFSTDTRMRLHYIIRTLLLLLVMNTIWSASDVKVRARRKRGVEFGDWITWYIPTDVTDCWWGCQHSGCARGASCTTALHHLAYANQPSALLASDGYHVSMPDPSRTANPCVCCVAQNDSSSSSTSAFPCHCHSLSNAHICCVNQRCCYSMEP